MAQAAFPQLNSTLPDLGVDIWSQLSIFNFACMFGHRHHARNWAGRKSPFPNNATTFFERLRSIVH
jgi:hypothetical protein